MRLLLPIFGAVALCSSVGSAQQCAVPQPYCTPSTCVPTPNVGTPPPSVGAPPKTNERFVRGPAPGSAAGESNSLGIRGPTLHIPEVRITLPNLELPSLFHVRHDAMKIFGTTLSPLIDEPALELSNVGEAPPDVGASPKVGAPACNKPCAPYCPPACAAPHASLDAQLRELNEKLARLEALEAQLTQLKEEQRTMMNAALTVAPVENASKPPITSGSVVKSSRPVPRPQAPKYQTASYEEPAEPTVVLKRAPSLPAKAASHPVQGRGRMGLSAAPVSTASSDNFGDWSAKK